MAIKPPIVWAVMLSLGCSGSGPSVLDAGRDAEFDAGACVQHPCAPSAICVEKRVAPGFNCESRFVSLTWRAPDAGTLYGASATVVGEVELISNPFSDGGGYPGEISGLASGFEFAMTRRETGLYVASIPSNQLSEGVVAFIAVFDGGGYRLDAGTTIRVDRTSPVADVRVQTEPVRFPRIGWDVAFGWRRDEKPLVLVEAKNEPILSAALTLAGSDAGVIGVGVPECVAAGLRCVDPDRCRCFEADLSGPPMPFVTGSFTAEALVTDLAGNTAAALPLAIPTTRLRWARALGSVLTSAAVVSKHGYLIVGTKSGLVAFNPDGSEKWRVTTGPIEAGLSIAVIAGREYVGYGTTTGTFGAVNVFNPAESMTCGSVSWSSYSGLAVGRFDGKTALVAMRNGPSNSMINFDALQQIRAFDCESRIAAFGDNTDYDVGTTRGELPMAPVVSGTTILLAGKDGKVRGYTGSIQNSNLSATMPGFPVDLSGSLTVFNGLALRMNGSKLVVGGGEASTGGLFQLAVSNPGGSTDWKLLLGGFTGAPTIRGSFAYFGHRNAMSANPTFRHADIGVGVPTLALPTFQTDLEIMTFPVAGDRELYALSPAGTLYVSGFTPSTMVTWSHNFSAYGAAAPLALDCNRPLLGGLGVAVRPGTLYLALADGLLVSVIVDSRGLDTTAEWPKYQRDAYNSGNANSVGELVNPGCP